MPIGFHEDILLRAMMRLRVGQGDIVYVITCSPIIGAVKRAIESLKAMCLRQGLIEPNVVELNCRDFYDSIRVLRKIIEKHRDLETYVCSGAGLRILVHLVEIALLTSRKTFNLYYEPEAEGVEPIFIPSQLYLNIYRKPSGLEEEILKIIIENPDISVKEITQTLEVKEKTVRNILTRLKNMGLITRSGKGRFTATPLAIALYS